MLLRCPSDPGFTNMFNAAEVEAGINALKMAKQQAWMTCKGSGTPETRERPICVKELQTHQPAVPYLQVEPVRPTN